MKRSVEVVVRPPPQKNAPEVAFGGGQLAVVALLTATLLTAATVRVLVLLARSFMPALSLSALMLASATLFAYASCSMVKCGSVG